MVEEGVVPIIHRLTLGIIGGGPEITLEVLDLLNCEPMLARSWHFFLPTCASSSPSS
jgi:hypothetical protein